MIAKNIANKTYKAVYVPDDEDVEIKDFVRLRKNACKARGLSKNKLMLLYYVMVSTIKEVSGR